MKFRTIYWLGAVVFISGCTAIGVAQFDQRYGEAQPRERVVEELPPGDLDYWSDVEPIIENRCVVCHGCYDAPCQLKLSSIEGIERGASDVKVYNPARLKAAPMTRLFEDADSVAAWRDQGFSPVINERENTPAANREASVMYKLLRLKRDNPLPNVKQLPDTSFDLSLDRKQVCAKTETVDQYARDHPLWGMPYALPGISGEEQNTLMQWVEQGAPYLARPQMPQAYRDQVEHWEAFLNGDSLKQQLASRYIFEHLSYAHLYFPEISEDRFFMLVRSATPPGQPIELIATRRPFNDPEVPRVYYRLREYVSSIVNKTHMPYRLDEARMRRWQTLFIDPQYDVTALPSYDEKIASNPFVTFLDIPVNSRYEFMLDEAQFTIMGFIKGPVCRGQIALSVIDDNFWVFFVEPESLNDEIYNEFMANQEEKLEMPASDVNIYNPIRHWRKYAKQQKTMLAAKDKFLSEHMNKPGELSLELIWDGNGENDNAALTVYRHFDSATVEKGLLGQPPKTAWLIGYTLLERIHYLLVAGYDIYGNLGHQVVSRLYMDFLRMEGESNFLMLLPREARNREAEFWYRGAEKEVMEFMALPIFENQVEPSIDYQTDDQKLELYSFIKQRLQPVLPGEHSMSAIADPRIRTELDRLNRIVGAPATVMPEAAFLQVRSAAGDQFVTLLRNTAHTNMTALFSEQKNLVPEENTLSVIPGFVGAYPNSFYIVEEADLRNFVDAIAGLNTESDYESLVDNWGVRRTNPVFWQHSDNFHTAFKKSNPLEAGILDYNRLENR
jgi:hypothetical protein